MAVCATTSFARSTTSVSSPAPCRRPRRISTASSIRPTRRKTSNDGRGAYLHVNCSGCHVEAGGGNAKMELALPTPREKMNLLSARPQHDIFGINNAMLVAPGAPERSVLLHRLARRGRGQMPPLVTNRVDDGAVRLFRDWIASLKPEL